MIRPLAYVGVPIWIDDQRRPQPRLLTDDRRRPCGPLARGEVPEPRGGQFQIGIVAEMKPEQINRLDADGGMTISTSRESAPWKITSTRIVGEVANPVLE